MSNKLAVIIGAGPGLGYGLAEKFGSEGFDIALVARTTSNLEELSSKLSKRGINVSSYEGDAGSETSMHDAMAKIIDQHGDPELVIYNAARAEKRSLLKEEWPRISETFDVTVGGAFNLIKNMLPAMMSNNRGKLLFTGGGFAIEPDPEFLSLSMGKAALRNLVYAAHKTADKSRVHVGMVTVNGFINADDTKYNPGSIAEEFWRLYDQEPDGYSAEFLY